MSKTDTKTGVQSHIESLEEQFRQFRDENESFMWEENVTDKEGHEATILVDFTETDYEEDRYETARVSAYGENNPTNDEEKIRNSEAFKEASKIVKEASREITESGDYPVFDTITTYEGGELVVENVYTIRWDVCSREYLHYF